MREPSDRQRSRPVRGPAASVVVLLLVAAAASACGSAKDGGGFSEARYAEAQLHFAQCMREHGVDFPDPKAPKDGEAGDLVFGIPPDGGGDLQTSDAFRSGTEACRSILDEAGPPPLSEEDASGFRDAALAYARCMREEGFDVPDLSVSGEGAGAIQLDPDDADPNDPALQAARERCSEHLPGVPGAKGDTP